MSRNGFVTSAQWVKGKKMILVPYVNDGLVAASDQQLNKFLLKLRTEFKIMSSEANYFLDQKYRLPTEIKISQYAYYAKMMLEKFGFTNNCKPVSTPIEKMRATTKKNKKIDEKYFLYRQVVGSLMYLMVGSRPDLAFSVGFLSRS